MKTLDFGMFTFRDSAHFLKGTLESLIKLCPETQKKRIRKVAEAHANEYGLPVDQVYKQLAKKGLWPYEYDWKNNLDTEIRGEHFKTRLGNEYTLYSTRTVLDENGDTETVREVDAIIENRRLEKQNEKHIETCRLVQEMKTNLGITTHRQLLRVYESVDVAGLCDVMENLRDTVFEAFKIDPVHCYGIPTLAKSIALKMIYDNRLTTGVEGIELLESTELYRFFDEAKVGGIALSKQQHAKAVNRPGMPDYDLEQPTVALEKQDAVGLYATCQHLKLPYGKFREYTHAEIQQLDPTDFVRDPKWGGLPSSPSDIVNLGNWQTDIGCTIEADRHIPPHLHDSLNELPPCPSHAVIDRTWLSPQQQQALKGTLPTRKLVPNLCDKKNYRCHISLAKLWLKLGCKITKIHAVVEWKQTDFLRPFIEKMSTLRSAATTDFEKTFWKDLGNSFYGNVFF